MLRYRTRMASATATDPDIYYTIDDAGLTTNSWTRQATTKEIVENSITAEQKKMMKEEIKLWMNSHLQRNIKKEAGKLLKDIENLKEEKKRLGKAISALKQEMRKTKKEVQDEIKSMEEMLEKYANQILRYQNMDL